MHSTFYIICYDLSTARFVINTGSGNLFPYSESTVRCTIYFLKKSMRVRFLKICKIFWGQFLVSCIQSPSFLKANYELSITRIIAPLNVSDSLAQSIKVLPFKRKVPGSNPVKNYFFFWLLFLIW